MIASRFATLSLALALSAGAAASLPRVFADDDGGFAAAEALVNAAEKDVAKIADARTAVEAAIKLCPGHPKCGEIYPLSARLWVIQADAAKKGDEKKAAYDAALAACSKAMEIDIRDARPWRLRVDILTKMGTARDEIAEALRALAVRLGADAQARENYRRHTGKIPALRVGDPMPLVVWKDSAGTDVKVADLWVGKPVVIELFRTTQWCQFCQKRIFELHDHAGEFEAENVRLVAVCADAPEKIAVIEKDGLKGRKPLKVRILVDTKGLQADILGVLNADSVKTGVSADAFGLPHPTTIIVDEAGIIRFIETHQDFKDRSKIDEIMAAIRRMRSPLTK